MLPPVIGVAIFVLIFEQLVDGGNFVDVTSNDLGRSFCPHCRQHFDGVNLIYVTSSDLAWNLWPYFR